MSTSPSTATTITNIDDLIAAAATNDLHGFYIIPDNIYHHADCPGMSRSDLNQFFISPRNYKIYKKAKTILEDKDTAALQFGRYFHDAMQDYGSFCSKYKALPEFFGPRGGVLVGEKKREAQREWEITNNAFGIDADEISRIKLMRDTIINNDAYRSKFANSINELTVFARCPVTNILLRARLDVIVADDYTRTALIADYKTCQPQSTANIHDLSRTIYTTYKLYLQASYYCYVVGLHNYHTEFKFLFIEKDLPYGFRIVSLPSSIIDVTGLRTIIDGLRHYAQCSHANNWPDNKTEIEIDMPFYMQKGGLLDD